MPYCTLADILGIVPNNDLIQLTDDSVPAQFVVTANVDKAIADSGELIDGYLRGRYTLPLAPLPGLITTLSGDIAVYRLYARRVKITPPEGVSERYKNALKLLEQIQTGKVALGADALSASGITPAMSGGAEYVAPDRTFTRDNLKDY